MRIILIIIQLYIEKSSNCRFRGVCPQGREGSTPSFGTENQRVTNLICSSFLFEIKFLFPIDLFTNKKHLYEKIFFRCFPLKNKSVAGAMH